MKTRIFAAVLTAVFLFALTSLTAYAKASDYEPAYPAPPIIPILEEAPPQRPFTPPGTGTVVDNVTNEDGKEFFTITSAAGNIFFLIIDRQRETENVYFLNAVTERDLLALAEESGDTWESTSTPPPVIPAPTPEPEEEPEEQKPTPEPDQGGNAGMMIIIVILIIGGGVAGWYFKVYKPKQQSAGMEDDFDFEEVETEDDISLWNTDEDGEDKEDNQ